jgi:hypothetical protein
MLQTFLLIWGLLHHGFSPDSKREDAWYIILDFFVTILLVLEVGIQIMARRRTFFNSWWNILDVVVCVACFLTLLFYIVDPWKTEEMISFLLLMARYFFQFVRLVLVLLRHRAR